VTLPKETPPAGIRVRPLDEVLEKDDPISMLASDGIEALGKDGPISMLVSDGV